MCSILVGYKILLVTIFFVTIYTCVRLFLKKSWKSVFNRYIYIQFLNLDFHQLIKLFLICKRIKRSKVPKRVNQTQQKSKKTDKSMTKIKKSSSNSPNTKQKTKNWATQNPPKIGSELRCSGRVGSSCSTNGTRRVAHGLSSICIPQYVEARVTWIVFLTESLVGIDHMYIWSSHDPLPDGLLILE